MEIQIIPETCGGTVFRAQPHRLHLGAQKAQGVDTLQFCVPQAWADCALALYLRRSDGTQLAPIPLDLENCVTVDRRLTGSTGGQWMLAAVRGTDYMAYTRPGSYDTYATLPTDGGSEELPPSQYEQFVARVLESARSAAESAKQTAADAARCADNAELAQSAADQILADRTQAADCAARAEAAAKRAEEIAPLEGQVLSVNGKGGVVKLGAQDVGALPRPARPIPGQLVRILSVDSLTGAIQTDTTPLPDLQPYVRSDTVPTAETPGAVRVDSRYGVGVRPDGILTTVSATNDQLNSTAEVCAPVTPAVLPYGVKQALTANAWAAGWTAEEKAAVLQLLGAVPQGSSAYLNGLLVQDNALIYSRGDGSAGSFQLEPIATSLQAGIVKIGANLSWSPDGTIGISADNVSAALGYQTSDLLTKLAKIDAVAYPEGKLVYSVGWNTTTALSVSLPSVSYVKVSVDSTGGSCKVARGASGQVLYFDPPEYLPITFAADGTLTVAAGNQTWGKRIAYSVEGYQYV